MTTATSPGALRETVRSAFGHDHLLPGQEAAISALLGDRDVLLVAPPVRASP